MDAYERKLLNDIANKQEIADALQNEKDEALRREAQRAAQEAENIRRNLQPPNNK